MFQCSRTDGQTDRRDERNGAILRKRQATVCFTHTAYLYA